MGTTFKERPMRSIVVALLLLFHAAAMAEVEGQAQGALGLAP